MRLPLFWLHDYCDPGLDAQALATRLDLTGTEVQRVLAHGVAALDRFVIGRVLSAEPHPDADRLTVCSVELGDDDPAQIVCGAPNVSAGQTVAVARPGAVMPDGTKLGKARLRGVESDGMILAEDEVGIGTNHAGIMVLDDGPEPGTPLADVLPIATDVLELEITPNRPDCLAIYGLAREAHAATGAELAAPPWEEAPGAAGDVPGFAVAVEDPDLCPRFTARLFEDVTIGPSPEWLKARLMAAGQRPISNVVDITNYAMLLTGQPMHAFDADLVAGSRLVVRRARAGERLVTLDDVERALDPDMCIIEDAEGPTSIAGIMGGARSEVSDSTTRVVMEAATWNGPNLQRTSQRLGLRTEASGRFEKQLQPEQAMEGQVVASRLMVELCGARPVGGTIDVGGPGPAARTVRLRDARTEALLGIAIERDEAAAILERLGFAVAETLDGLDVAVPHWRRGDVYREADLIEEVARIHGLDALPITLPSRRGATGRLSVPQRLRRRAEDALVGCGLSEAVGWSFTAPDLPDRLTLPAADPRRRAVALLNPMSEDQSSMRTALLGSLLDSVRHNRARGMEDVRLFEYGAVYLAREGNGSEPLPDERQHVAAVLTGGMQPASWREAEPPRADFFTAKGVLAAVMEALRAEWKVEAAVEPFLHPGRSAAVLVRSGVDAERAAPGGASPGADAAGPALAGPERPAPAEGAASAGEAGWTRAGWLGELHPAVTATWDLPSAAGFELDFGALARAAVAVPTYEDITSYPAVRQDLAVVVGEAVPAGDVVAAVREAGGPLLAAADVFDVYRGAQVGEGRVSLALALEFRAPDRTLTDEEVAARREKIVAALATQLGGEIRA